MYRLPPTLCSTSSLQTVFNKCMPSFTCHHWPLVAFLEFTELNTAARDLDTVPSPFSCCFSHPALLCSSPIHKSVKVQISQFWPRQLYPVFARGHALSSNRPFTLYLSIMICLVTSVFFRNLLNDWTPPEAMPEEMSCSAVWTRLHINSNALK